MKTSDFGAPQSQQLTVEEAECRTPVPCRIWVHESHNADSARKPNPGRGARGAKHYCYVEAGPAASGRWRELGFELPTELCIVRPFRSKIGSSLSKKNREDSGAILVACVALVALVGFLPFVVAAVFGFLALWML